MSEPADGVGSVGKKERSVGGFAIVILGRNPEIIEHQQAVFVSEFEEHAFGALPHPVADGVDIGIAVEPEIRLHPLARNALEPVVHSPVAAAHGDRHAIDAQQSKTNTTPQEPFYRVLISLPKQTMDVFGKEQNLLPGMTAQAEIKIREKTIIEFFLDPFRKYTSEALRER